MPIMTRLSASLPRCLTTATRRHCQALLPNAIRVLQRRPAAAGAVAGRVAATMQKSYHSAQCVVVVVGWLCQAGLDVVVAIRIHRTRPAVSECVGVDEVCVFSLEFVCALRARGRNYYSAESCSTQTCALPRFFLILIN